MRAEPAAARLSAPPRDEPTRGFDAALLRAAGEAAARARRAELRRAGNEPGLAPTAFPALGAARDPAAFAAAQEAAPARGAGAAAAARAIAAVTVSRSSGEARLEVATADGVRYALAASPGGVEIRASAPPALERVARADLHAVADSLRRRGVAVTRSAVATGPVPRGGAREGAGGATSARAPPAPTGLR